MLGEPGRVTVDRADGTIELTEAEVNRLLADRLQGGTLAIKEDGVEVRAQVQLLGQSLEALVTGELGARDGRVTFTPDEIRLGEQGRIDPSQADLLASQFTFQVPLPELPAGVRLERVDTRPGTVVLQRPRGGRPGGRLIRWAYDPGVLVHGPAGGDAGRRGRVRRLRGLPPAQGLSGAPGRSGQEKTQGVGTRLWRAAPPRSDQAEAPWVR